MFRRGVATCVRKNSNFVDKDGKTTTAEDVKAWQLVEKLVDTVDKFAGKVWKTGYSVKR